MPRRPTPPGRAGRPTNRPNLGPVLGFMRVLWALDHALVRTSKAMRTRHGVTGPQRLAIRIVGRFPGISAGELAQVLHLHPSTLTGVLQRLEARALMERRRDPRDARRALLWLTARGRAVDDLKSETVEARVRAALASLPDRDVRAAERVLLEIARRLTPQ